MTAMTDDLRDDLAYVKALAEEGRDTPLVNGAFYVLWGGLMSAAALIVYVDNVGLINLGAAGGLPPWLTAFVIGWAGSMVIGRKTHSKPGAMTIGNRTAASVWFAVGLFISAFWITLMIVHDNFTALGVPPYFLFSLVFPIAFGLFGVAFFATATAARANWLRYVAFLAWAFSIITLVLAASVHQMLAAAIGVFACSVVPGFILMRSEPSEIV